MTGVCNCVLTVQRGTGSHTGPGRCVSGKGTRLGPRGRRPPHPSGSGSKHTFGGAQHTLDRSRVCAADSTDVCSHTCPCSCVHTCPYVSGHGLPIVTTSPAAPQKGLSAAIPLVGSRAASGLALFFPHEVSFPPPASGPLLPREFPLSCSRWPGAAGRQEKQDPARSALLAPPPCCGPAPLPMGCDCGFPAVSPVPPGPRSISGALLSDCCRDCQS